MKEQQTFEVAEHARPKLNAVAAFKNMLLLPWISSPPTMLKQDGLKQARSGQGVQLLIKNTLDCFESCTLQA
eukprot:1160112-Pelagomonas_calceolata.AAC.2